MARVAFHSTVVLGRSGAVIEAAQVTVRDSLNNIATIYEEREGGDTKANPFTTDEDGEIFFYAEEGLRYKIEAIQGTNYKALIDIVLPTEFALKNPITGNGDLITAISGSIARIAPGTEGQVLTMVSGIPTWVTPA